MADVGVGRLVTVERLAVADRLRPEVDPGRRADVAARTCGAVPDVEHHQQDEDQASPSHQNRVPRPSGRPSVVGAQLRRLASSTERDTAGPGRRVSRDDRNTSRIGQTRARFAAICARYGPRFGVDLIIRRRLERAPEEVGHAVLADHLLDPPQVVISRQEDRRPVARDPELPGEPGHDPGRRRDTIRMGFGSSRPPRGAPASGADTA